MEPIAVTRFSVAAKLPCASIMISRSVPLVAVLLLSACASAPDQTATLTKAVYTVEAGQAKAGAAAKSDPNAGHRIFWFVGGR
jgi:hypothetical protein